MLSVSYNFFINSNKVDHPLSSIDLRSGFKMAEVESLETLIEKAGSALDEREMSEMKRIIYGSPAL